ncbi:MAG: RidA family protein [Gammaproteobacteria bacterium]|nr:RidA family protein [Gammaproteobacteria bacterium]
MNTKKIIFTEGAPRAIGPYSQAVQCGNTVYLSGQIPLDPMTMKVVEGHVQNQALQVFKNLKAVCEAAGGDLSSIAKLTIFLVDLSHFNTVNEVMGEFFKEPYPARSTIQVTALPKAVLIEIEAIMVV